MSEPILPPLGSLASRLCMLRSLEEANREAENAELIGDTMPEGYLRSLGCDLRAAPVLPESDDDADLPHPT